MGSRGPRSPNGETKVYKGADGYFHGSVFMGQKEDGSEDRRHVMYRDEGDAIKEVRKLEKQRDAGLVATVGRVPTVAEWMRTWLDTIAPHTALQTTVDEIYRPKVERWIIPRLGKHRLDRLLPEHVDASYTWLPQQGLSTKSVLLIHQILTRAEDGRAAGEGGAERGEPCVRREADAPRSGDRAA